MYAKLFRVAGRYTKITSITVSVLVLAGCAAPYPNQQQSSGTIYTPTQRVYAPAPVQRVYTPVQRVYTPAPPVVQRIYTPVQRVYTPAPVQPRVYERNTTIYRNTYNNGNKPTYDYRNPPRDYRHDEKNEHRHAPHYDNRNNTQPVRPPVPTHSEHYQYYNPNPSTVNTRHEEHRDKGSSDSQSHDKKYRQKDDRRYRSHDDE